MLTNTLFQELCHLEVRIPEQSRNTYDRSHHLSIERPTTISNQEVWLLAVNQSTNKADCLFRVHRKVWRNDFCKTLERITQCQGWYTLTTGIETVQEKNLFHTFLMTPRS